MTTNFREVNVARGLEHMEHFSQCQEIVCEVMDETEEQVRKFGVQNREPSDYLMILGEEVGEANKAALDAKFNMGYERSPNLLKEYRAELIQVAAVAVSAIAALDRNELKPVAKVVEMRDAFFGEVHCE